MRRQATLLSCALALIALLLYLADLVRPAPTEGDAAPAIAPPGAPEPSNRAVSQPKQAEPAEGEPRFGAGSVYGVQVFFSGTLSLRKRLIDGVPQKTGTVVFTIERYVFVDDSATQPLRTYVSCGFESSMQFELGTRASELEHRSVRRRPDGSVVLLPRESEEPELELPGTRWDLGLAPFVPRAPCRLGDAASIPNAAVAELLFAGGDLRLRELDSQGPLGEALMAWAWPSSELAGSTTGAIISTEQAPESGDASGRCVARIAVDLLANYGGAPWTRLPKQPAGSPMLDFRSDGACTMSGIGLSIRGEQDPRPPQLELHIVWAADHSSLVEVEGKPSRIEIEEHMEGRLVVLGGQRERNPELSNVVAKPREQFLAEESFLLKP